VRRVKTVSCVYSLVEVITTTFTVFMFRITSPEVWQNVAIHLFVTDVYKRITEHPLPLHPLGVKPNKTPIFLSMYAKFLLEEVPVIDPAIDTNFWGG